MNNLDEIKYKIKDINKIFLDRYEKIFSLTDDDFKKNVLDEVGYVKSLKKLDTKELISIGKVVGVDGSVNRVGGAFPHYIDIFQALAKSTMGEDIFLNDVYTPFIDNKDYSDDVEEDRRKRDRRLAIIEMEVALKAIDELSPNVILMDGGLIRYKISNGSMYNNLVDTCIKNDVILVGVIKDIKTKIISEALGDGFYYDREILYGKFKQGQMLIVNDELNKKYSETDGLVSCFLRGSVSPNVIGIDLPSENSKYLSMVANLVYSLIPTHSRGVPLWLDIVDSEVKIKDSLMNAMLEEYLDRHIYERFFVSERDRRTL